MKEALINRLEAEGIKCNILTWYEYQDSGTRLKGNIWIVYTFSDRTERDQSCDEMGLAADEFDEIVENSPEGLEEAVLLIRYRSRTYPEYIRVRQQLDEPQALADY